MRIPNRFFIVVILLFPLTSCIYIRQPHPHADNLFSEPKPDNANSAQALPALPAIAADAKPAANPKKKSTQKFFNVSVHNIDVREFFMGLVMDSNENIVLHPDVTGTLSLTLKNVTLAEVIDVVEKVYGYDCEKNKIGYLIYPAKLQTKTFKIDRLDLLRVGRSNIQISSGQTPGQTSQQGNNQQGSNQQNNNYQLNNQQGSSSSQSSQAIGSRVTTTTETDFWKELEEALHSILGIDPQATVTMNKQTGVIVVRAKPMQLHEVENFINATQNQISRQVILEAKIMEVILDDSHQDGVNWKVLAQKGLNSVNLLTGFGIPDPTKFSSVFTLGSNIGDFSAMAELLETQGRTNVLSSPRISTLNNQKAIIKVGKEEFFIVGFTPGTYSANVSGSSASPPTPNLSSYFSGISLDVTPQIDDEDNVSLHIHPAITKVENLVKIFTASGSDYSVPTPLNTVRESDSIVKAHNGQVIVLGGLMQESEIENKEGITGLASIPGLGHLFRVDKGTTQKSELIILLKASIINSSADWQDKLDSRKERLEELESQPMWK